MSSAPQIVAHLDLDGPWVAARAPWREDQEGQLLVEALEPAGQGAGRGHPRRELPEVAHEEQGVAEADARGRHPLALRHVLHVQAEQVVGDREPPDLLTDAL